MNVLVTGGAGYIGSHAVRELRDAGHTVSVLDVSTNTVVSTLPAGSSPYNIAITPDGSAAYVTNYGDGTVTVLDAPGAPGTPGETQARRVLGARRNQLRPRAGRGPRRGGP